MLQTSTNPLLVAESKDELRVAMRKKVSAKRRMMLAQRQGNAAEQIAELPGHDEEIVMIMTGDYHGWDIVGAVISLAGVGVRHLRVATLGFNQAQTLHLAEMLDDKTVGQFSMVVSEMFRDKNKSEFASLRQELEDRGQALACGRNHAKVMCFDLEDGRTIVTHGSLNLRRCNSYEQISISGDRKLHDFFAEFIDGQM